jgi:pimeloyl-ACP methyl ester carboxylesterase
MFLQTSASGAAQRAAMRAGKMDLAFGRTLFPESVAWDTVYGMATLQAIAAPTLRLQATFFDFRFKRAPLRPGMRTPFTETVARLVPHAEATIILGSGHFPMIDAPDAVNRTLREFADWTSPRARATRRLETKSSE